MPEKILLVDDNRQFRVEFAECLSDYDVIQASDGQEALDILSGPNEIDLVILDVMMPGLSGTEVLKKLRLNLPELSIIILTGYSSKEVAVEALKGRADDYLEKPVDIEKAREVIENVLARKRFAGKPGDAGIKGKIEKVKLYLQRNASKKVRLNDAAQAVCLSPKYLSRVFEEVAGVRFTAYRLRLKMDLAKQLFKENGCNVDQAADKLGYKNSESFIRQFKKISGITPAVYCKSKCKN